MALPIDKNKIKIKIKITIIMVINDKNKNVTITMALGMITTIIIIPEYCLYAGCRGKVYSRDNKHRFQDKRCKFSSLLLQLVNTFFKFPEKFVIGIFLVMYF